MAWLAVNKNGSETIFAFRPFRRDPDKSICKLWEPEYWSDENSNEYDNEDTGIALPKGTIKKLIGKTLTWEDEPVELKEEII